MLKRFLIAAVYLLTACQSAAPTPTRVTLTPTVGATATSALWVQTQMNGVTLGLWKPPDWESDLSHGLALAEHINGTGAMLLYCFVPQLTEYGVMAGAANLAWEVLNKVAQTPYGANNDATFSQPVSFQWDGNGAAYLLLSTGDGVRALVLALTVPNQPKVAVCEMSISMSQASRIRGMLPHLLDDLAVNGRTIHGGALSSLPDPLPFPRYVMSSVQQPMPGATP